MNIISYFLQTDVAQRIDLRNLGDIINEENTLF